MSESFNIGLGAVAGVIWNVASLACLSRLLKAWLGPRPSQRAAIAWLLMKIALLGAVLTIFTRVSTAFIIGFGVGFTGALTIAILKLVLQTRRPSLIRSHGR